MRIVHLSQSDSSGGAARAAWRVHQHQVLLGADATMLVASRGGSDARVHQFHPRAHPLAALARHVRRFWLRRANVRALAGRDPGFEHFRDDREEFGAQVLAGLPPADVFNLHQISGFLDYRAVVPELARRAPLTWTLHDMTPMTGGCPYAYACEGFTRTCGNCPQIGQRGPHDLSHQIWQRKQSAFARIPAPRLHVICPSRWMADEARRSSLLGRFPVSVVPNGVDVDVFRRRPNARRLLDDFGAPPAAKVVLFLADYLGNRRKGFALLDEALAACAARSDFALLSLGRDQPRLRTSIPHVHLGNLHDDHLIAAIYSMADVFVIPSLQDNLPNTVLESLACETPVVGFRIGGIPDMVREGENGLLVPSGDVGGLASAIAALLDDDARRLSMGRAGRARVEQEFTLQLQAQRYLDVYRSVVGAQ